MKTFNLKTFLISALRRASYRTPARSMAMKNAKLGYNQYKCAKCNNIFGRRDIQVDHIIPVVGPEGFKDWNTYIERMFCGSEGLQILCRDVCHKNKSAEEKQKRVHKSLTRQRKKRRIKIYGNLGKRSNNKTT